MSRATSTALGRDLVTFFEDFLPAQRGLSPRSSAATATRCPGATLAGAPGCFGVSVMENTAHNTPNSRSQCPPG